MPDVMECFGKILPTSNVGSLPLGSVYNALKAQVEAGLDWVTSGAQYIVEGNMVEAFLKTADQKYYPNIRKEPLLNLDGFPEVIKISRTLEELTPQQIGKNMVVQEIKEARNILNDLNKKEKKESKLKGTITGPTSIAMELQTGWLGIYDTNPEQLVVDLTEKIILPIVSVIREYVDALHIDEHEWAVRWKSHRNLIQNVGVEMITKISEKVGPKPVVLHCCKAIPEDLAKLLLSIEGVSVLDHEFMAAESKDNFGTFSKLKNYLEKNDKIIGLGVIDTSNRNTEAENVISSKIRQGISLFGEERLLIKPDNGFTPILHMVGDEREVSRICIDKLNVMMKCVETLRRR